jgi:zinc finger RNA-binding protein
MLAGKKTNEAKSGNEQSFSEESTATGSSVNQPNTASEPNEPAKSDQTEKDPSTASSAAIVATTNGSNTTNSQMFRALKGVMRVGLLAKGLLLKGDTDVQLIVLCADKPNKRLLERVYNILTQKIDIVSPQIKYSVILDKQAETIVIIKTTISDLQPLITCKVLLTSPAVRTSSEQLADQAAAAASAGANPIDKPTEASLKSGFYFDSYFYQLFKQFEKTVFFLYFLLENKYKYEFIICFCQHHKNVNKSVEITL